MTAYDGLFADAAAVYGVPQDLLEALARTESGLRSGIRTWEAKAGEYSYGLFQILESTARGLGFDGDAGELLDPALNTALAGQLARQLIDRLGSGFNLASFYSLYNSGRAELWNTSNQVAAHVKNFLENFGDVVGVNVPEEYSIAESLELLAGRGADVVADNSGLALAGLAGLGLIVLLARRR